MVEQLGRQVLVALRYRSEHVSTSVGRVHVWSVEGGGALPGVLLFHGLASSGMHWMPLVAQLRPHVARVTALDLPGHGFSDRPDELTHEVLTTGVLEALDAVDLEPGLVVGNSLGGAAAVRFLAARPERARRALLFSPAGAPMSADELADLRDKFRVDRHMDAVSFVRRLSGREVGLRAHLLAPWLRRSLGDPLLRRWLASVTPDQFLTPEELRDLRVPVEVVWGRQERMLPDSAREFWRAHLPADALEEPDGFGHTPFLDDRRWTAARILASAERVAGRGSIG